MQSLIREPALEWAAGQTMVVTLDPLTLPDGRAVTDFATFTLKVREDPSWPRSGQTLARAGEADPIADGWAVAVTSTGSLNGDDVPEFTFVMPSGAGIKRYAVDAWGTLSGGAEVQLVRATWLTCGARVV